MPAHHDRLSPAGPGHPRVRQYLNLKLNRGPSRAGRVALEGLWILRSAMDRAVPIEVVLVCPELLRGAQSLEVLDQLRKGGVPAFSVSPKTFGRLASRDGPDGLAAVAQLKEPELNALVVGPVARVLVLDRFELAGNVGSLIRCADAVGATAVILADCPVRLGHPLLLKASMGAVFSMPVSRVDGAEALGWLRGHRFQVVVADPAGPVGYRGVHYGPRTALVLGSERYGISDAWRDHADQVVAIPLRGTTDSLNAGHAGAVVLYEILHQQEAQLDRSHDSKTPRGPNND